MTLSLANVDCPEQLNRWPCPLLTVQSTPTSLGCANVFFHLKATFVKPRDHSPRAVEVLLNQSQCVVNPHSQIRRLHMGFPYEKQSLSIQLRGALKTDFWEYLGFCPNQEGGGSDPIPSFLNQNHMVILLGFCHNKGWGFPVPTPKMGLFHEKIICLE